MTIATFGSDKELLQYASRWIKGRLRTLESDVELCTQTAPYAPFLALLSCFTHIDLLGALCAGKASRLTQPQTTKQSADYMRDFMGYKSDQRDALQLLFRHNLVHLAEPKIVKKLNGVDTSWGFFRQKVKWHMVTHSVDMQIMIDHTPWVVPYKRQFDVSIPRFAEDIVRSVTKPGGYLAALKNKSHLRRNFRLALNDIYDPAR